MRNVFQVRALRVADANKAKILEALVNRQQFVQSVMNGVERLTNEFYLPNILYGTPIDNEKFDARIKEIAEEETDK